MEGVALFFIIVIASLVLMFFGFSYGILSLLILVQGSFLLGLLIAFGFSYIVGVVAGELFSNPIYRRIVIVLCFLITMVFTYP